MLRGWSRADWVLFWIKLLCNPIAWAVAIMLKVLVALYVENTGMPTWAEYRAECGKTWAKAGIFWMKTGVVLWHDDDGGYGDE